VVGREDRGQRESEGVSVRPKQAVSARESDGTPGSTSLYTPTHHAGKVLALRVRVPAADRLGGRVRGQVGHAHVRGARQRRLDAAQRERQAAEVVVGARDGLAEQGGCSSVFSCVYVLILVDWEGVAVECVCVFVRPRAPSV